ncbi:MAG: hypothetical protein IJ767_01030 [Bacteroidaceae bacterium]|nr:hypothetical protein [Bacteroidaceae bacterium]
METNDPITRLLEMLEHPEAYSEQEIHDLIHHDEATRQAYEWMVTARQSYRLKEAERPADVDAAWQRFQEAHPLPKGGGRGGLLSYRKIAAIFLAAAFLGGLAWAIGGLLLTSSKEKRPQPTQVTAPSLIGRAGGESSILFADIRLDSMLTVVAQHYDKAVYFGNDELKGLRIHTRWNPEDSLAVFIENLNELDGLLLMEQRDTIFVQGKTHPSPSL